MGVSISEIKPSMAIVFEQQVYIVLECEHAKLGRGSAFCRVKLRNLKTSEIKECTLRDADKIEEAFIERRKLQYIYREGNIFHFLDQEVYEDLTLESSAIDDKIMWLKDNLEVTGIFYNNQLVSLELPHTIEMKVIDTEPGFRGDTVKTGTKPAKLETGVIIQVPLFINEGDVIKVDTRKKEYVGRV